MNVYYKPTDTFKGNIKALDLLHTNLTVDSASSISGIRDEIIALKILIDKDHQQQDVALETGWHAPKARRFLIEHGFETSFYSPVLNGEWGWSCSSDSIPIGRGSHPRNIVTYYLSGTEEAVTSLKLNAILNSLA